MRIKNEGLSNFQAITILFLREKFLSSFYLSQDRVKKLEEEKK